MNFNMFHEVSVHLTKDGQYLVQGSRVFITDKGKPTIYPPETFLITSVPERAWHKHNLLCAHTCHL